MLQIDVMKNMAAWYCE